MGTKPAAKATPQDSFVTSYIPAALFSLTFSPPHPEQRSCLSLLLASHCTGMWDCYRSSPCLKKGWARVKYTRDCRASTEAMYLHIINQNLDHLTHPNKLEPIKLKIRQFNETKHVQVTPCHYPDHRNTAESQCSTLSSANWASLQSALLECYLLCARAASSL